MMADESLSKKLAVVEEVPDGTVVARAVKMTAGTSMEEVLTVAAASSPTVYTVPSTILSNQQAVEALVRIEREQRAQEANETLMRLSRIHVSTRTIVNKPAMRAGRNDPCICGSGKKFKKCCLGQKQPTKGARAVRAVASLPVH